jgi:hypothetical protein
MGLRERRLGPNFWIGRMTPQHCGPSQSFSHCCVGLS